MDHRLGEVGFYKTRATETGLKEMLVQQKWGWRHSKDRATQPLDLVPDWMLAGEEESRMRGLWLG